MNGDLIIPPDFVPRPASILAKLDRDYGTYTDRWNNCTAHYHSFGRRLLAAQFEDGRTLVHPDYV